MTRNVVIVAAVIALVVTVACMKNRSCSTCGTCGPSASGGKETDASESASPQSPGPTGEGDAPTSRPAVQALPRLVELGAGKCQACKRMAPIIEELKKEYAGRVIVESIDVIEQAERARQYKFTLIPTQVLIDKDGKEVWRHMGSVPKADLIAKFKEVGVK